MNFSALITVINFKLLMIILISGMQDLKGWVIFILKVFDESLMVFLSDVV